MDNFGKDYKLDLANPNLKIAFGIFNLDGKVEPKDDIDFI